jgi:hypothetical protein
MVTMRNQSEEKTVFNLTDNTKELETYKCASTTTLKPEEEVEVQAFLYIVVVIGFYAISIVFLLIKYARRDDEEKNSKYHYSEFVNREKFQTAQYKNKIAVEKTKEVLGSLDLASNVSLAIGTACPIIIVSEFCDNLNAGKQKHEIVDFNYYDFGEENTWQCNANGEVGAAKSADGFDNSSNVVWEYDNYHHQKFHSDRRDSRQSV